MEIPIFTVLDRPSPIRFVFWNLTVTISIRARQETSRQECTHTQEHVLAA